MNMKRATIVLTLFILSLFCAGIINAQTVLEEEWEIHYNQRSSPKKILDAIGVKPGMVIGEVGVGYGRITVYLAREVGPKGIIYANDINEDYLKKVSERCKKNGFKNVETILGKEDDPLFPIKSLDMAVMAGVFHELNKPDDILKNIKHSLKPSATLVITEMKKGVSLSSINKEIEQSAKAAGFEVVKYDKLLNEVEDYIFILKQK